MYSTLVTSIEKWLLWKILLSKSSSVKQNYVHEHISLWLYQNLKTKPSHQITRNSQSGV